MTSSSPDADGHLLHETLIHENNDQFCGNSTLIADVARMITWDSVKFTSIFAITLWVSSGCSEEEGVCVFRNTSYIRVAYPFKKKIYLREVERF